MSTSTTQLPTLSPENRATLLRYFSLRENPEALAAALNQDLISIYEWLTSPAIAPWLNLHREHKDRALQDSLQSTLQKLLDKPLNLIEARRTATTLLRSLHIATRAPRAHQRHTAPVHSCSPSLREGVGGREPSPQFQPANAAAPLTPPTSVIHSSSPARGVGEREPSLQSLPTPIPVATPVFSRTAHSPIQSLLSTAGRAASG